jgi:hypothetical protein
MRRAEAPRAVGRADAPADQQWTRALIAVALGLALAFSMVTLGADEPNLRTMLPELRALAGVSCFVI